MKVEIINPEDKNVFDKLYVFRIDNEAYKVYANNEQQVLEIAVAYMEIHNSNSIISIEAVREEIYEEYAEEFEAYQDENPEADDMTFATEVLNYVYVDGTMEGASQPYYLNFIYGFDIKEDNGEEVQPGVVESKEVETKRLKKEYYVKPDNVKIIWDSEFDATQDIDAEEVKETDYQDYIEELGEDEEPLDFEEWLDRNLEIYADNVWEAKEDDLTYNILPMIDGQVVDNVVILSGDYGSNYPDFRPSGSGGRTFNGTDGIRDYMGKFDRVCFTLTNGVIGMILADHDGTVSGNLLTIPTGDKKVELLRAMGYEEQVREYRDDEEIENYGMETLMEDEFESDWAYDNVDTRELLSHTDLLVPIKDTFNSYDPEPKKENKDISKATLQEAKEVEYISQEELDKLPDDYKTTIADTLKVRKAVGDNVEELSKLYKDLGYEETDPMILSSNETGTILKPVKVKTESIKIEEHEEDMEQVETEVETAVEETETTDLAKEQVASSLEVLKVDEEGAIDGYESFVDQAEKILEPELAEELKEQMEEIIEDEKDHMEKLDTIKDTLEGNASEEETEEETEEQPEEDVETVDNSVEEIVEESKLVENTESKYKQKFIDYSKDKIEDLGTVHISYEEEEYDAQIWMIEYGRYIINPESIDGDPECYISVDPETKEIVHYSPMSDALASAVEMQFTKISQDLYNLVVEYWEEADFDESVELDEVTEEQEEKIKREFKVPADFKYNIQHRNGGADVEVYAPSDATTTTMKGSEHVQEYFDIDGLWQVSIYDDNGKWVNYEYVTGWQEMVKLVQEQASKRGKTSITESKNEITFTVEEVYSLLNDTDLDTEYREAFAHAQMKMFNLSDTPLRLATGTAEQRKELRKANRTKLNMSQVEEIINMIAQEMKGDYQFGKFIRFANDFGIKLNKGKKTEAEETPIEEGTISVDMNTGVLPIVDVDMYSMNEYINDYEVTQEELDSIVKEVAPDMIEEVLKKVLPSAKVTPTNVYHPKQYNFEGDELEFTLNVNGEEYEKLKTSALDNENFAKYLKDNYSSYSGFVSYLADNKEDFEAQEQWKQMVQVIMFSLQDIINEDTQGSYLDAFINQLDLNYEKVNDLEENKKVVESIDYSKHTTKEIMDRVKELTSDTETMESHNIEGIDVITTNTKTNGGGVVVPIMASDEVKVFEGNPSGEDDKVYSVEEFDKDHKIVKVVAYIKDKGDTEIDIFNLNKEEKITEGKDTVTEYVITFDNGEDFISEDEKEADEKFAELVKSGEIKNVHQYYRKDWKYNQEGEEDGDYEEGYVEVFYNQGDEIPEHLKEAFGSDGKVTAIDKAFNTPDHLNQVKQRCKAKGLYTEKKEESVGAVLGNVALGIGASMVGSAIGDKLAGKEESEEIKEEGVGSAIVAGAKALGPKIASGAKAFAKAAAPVVKQAGKEALAAAAVSVAGQVADNVSKGKVTEDAKGNTATLYQVENTRDFGFMRYDYIQEHGGVDINNYREVITIDLDELGLMGNTIEQTLENIFDWGNTNTIGNGARSISVSDIIEVNGRMFYCDAIGFKELNTEVETAEEVPYDDTSVKVCPKCNKEYTEYPALSRRDNKTYICPGCGTREAIEDFVGNRRMIEKKTEANAEEFVKETSRMKELGIWDGQDDTYADAKKKLADIDKVDAELNKKNNK